VNVATLERPTPRARSTGGSPARYAIVRWAWRLARREWRQRLLILLLVAFAVAATTAGIALASNAGRSDAAAFGSADHMLIVSGADPNLASDLGAIRAAFPDAEVIAHQRIAIPGSVEFYDLRAQDPTGRYGSGTLRLRSGRYPTGRDDVAVTHGVASTFDLHVGSAWTVDGGTRHLVGIVENPRDLHDQFALVAPGAAEPPATIDVLVDATSQQLAGVTRDHDVLVAGQQPFDETDAAVIVLAFETVGLIFVGLVAAASFTVMAQRRMRSLGMLGALGATDRHVRLAMVADGAVVGAVAAVVGGAVGVLGWLLFAPHAESLVDHRIDRFAVPWWAVVAAMVLAALAATVSAWWPARSIARLSVVASLSGRPPRPHPARRFASLGALLLVVGFVALTFANRGSQRPVDVPVFLAGVLATIVGILLFAPLATRVLARVAHRAPIVVRLVVRDLARYQARAAAAIGAITLAIAISATIAVSATAAAPHSSGVLAANQLVVHVTGGVGKVAVDGVPAFPAWDSPHIAAFQQRVDSLAGDLHASVTPLLQAVYPPAGTFPGPSGGDVGPARVPAGNGPAGSDASGAGSPAFVAPVAMARLGGPGAGPFDDVTNVFVATPAVLRHVGLSPSDVSPGTDVLTSGDLAHSVLATPHVIVDSPIHKQPYVWHPTVRHADLPTGTRDTTTLITEQAMRKFGLQPVTVGWLVETPRALTSSQIDLARHTAAAAGLTVQTRPSTVSFTRLRNGATVAGLLLALGVLAMTVGLIRSETANDLRTLTATGASPTMRRMLTGATAGALALLGTLLGVSGCYLALVAWHRHDLAPLGHVPYVNLVVILVGLPAAALAGGWLLAGREPPALGRRPIE
jgi:putative ABC transport system permease protein